MAPAGGLLPEAAAMAGSWLSGEPLALLWVLQVLEPRLGVRSMKLSRPLTPLDSWGLGGQLPFADELRTNSSQDPYDVGRAGWNGEGGPLWDWGWPWFCSFAGRVGDNFR